MCLGLVEENVCYGGGNHKGDLIGGKVGGMSRGLMEV